MTEFRYKAFISYSHADEPWARWLHRALESYRIPRKLVGARTGAGVVPKRFRPVFRDRDELASAADLSATVIKALSESENLIVICSPAAAASHWVKEEIREFTRLGRRDRIFCIIVDGEADETGSVAALFPDAIAEAGLEEPLAADARKWADGKHLAKLKLIAGVLGMPLDQLRRRDLQKRRKRWALTAAGIASVAVIIFLAVSARMAAEQRRNFAESLVASKLTELRAMLVGVEDPEELARLREWDEQELEQLVAGAGPEKEDLDNEALRLRGQGLDLWENGDLVGALDQFNASWALQAVSYQRDRSDQESFFQLGQAEYWIGEMHDDLGDLEAAESAWLSYTEITRRLIRLQPQNADWVLEMAYALTNLGNIERIRSDINPDRALQYMQSALDYNNIALVLDPGNDYYKSELGQSFANLADAQLNICDLDGALQSRREGVRLETELLQGSRNDTDRLERLAWALTGQGLVLANKGMNDLAIKDLEHAIILIEQVSSQQPNSRVNRLDLAERREYLARLKGGSGRTEEAWAEMSALSAEWEILIEGVELDDVEDLLLYSILQLDRAWLAHERGDTQLAGELIDKGFGLLAAESMRLLDNRRVENALVLAAYRYWEIRRELPPNEILTLLPDYRAYEERTRACKDASRAVRKAVMMGNPGQAADLVEYLLNNGYRESGFMRMCTKYYDCTGE